MAAKQKTALITGSSRGIGRGIALKLAEQGARIAVHYYQNEKAANATLTEIRKRGGEGFILQADVTDPEAVRRLVEVRPRTSPMSPRCSAPTMHPGSRARPCTPTVAPH